MSMKFCVIGLGRFGYHVAARLADNGMEVLAVDSNEAIVASIRDKVSQAICMRVTDEDALRSIGAEDMDTVIVAMGENFAQSILVTALLKHRLNIKKVITRSISEIHREILQLIGADEVILPEREEGRRLADSLSLPFKSLFRLSDDYCIGEFPVPEKFVGKNLKTLDLHGHYEVTPLGKIEDDEVVPVDEDEIIEANRRLVLVGSIKELTRFTKL